MCIRTTSISSISTALISGGVTVACMNMVVITAAIIKGAIVLMITKIILLEATPLKSRAKSTVG